MKTENFVVVLVEPRRQGNVGAAARAMKNCGLSALRLVRGAKCGKEARRMAVHASDVLDRARRFPNLEAAVGDAVRIVGFCAKDHRGVGSRSLPEIAPALRRSAQAGRVALVFGREDEGLRVSEVRLCNDTVRIPASPEYSVFNLAQSVLLAGYEILLAPRRVTVAAETTGDLPRARRKRVVEEWSALLPRLAYEKPRKGNRTARILRRLSGQMERALREEADRQMWLGLLRRLRQRVEPSPPRSGPRRWRKRGRRSR